MLSREDKALIDQFRAAAAGESPEGLAKGMAGASGATLRRYLRGSGYPGRMEATTRRALRDFLKSREEPEEGRAPVATPLDEWGATNARVMERLAGLLERDQVIIELRAQTELLRLAIEAGVNASELQAVARQGLRALRLVGTAPGNGDEETRGPQDGQPNER